MSPRGPVVCAQLSGFKQEVLKPREEVVGDEGGARRLLAVIDVFTDGEPWVDIDVCGCVRATS